jgi:hypothetical protein
MLHRRAEQPLRKTNLERHPHKLMVFRDRHTHIMTNRYDNYVEAQRGGIQARIASKPSDAARADAATGLRVVAAAGGAVFVDVDRGQSRGEIGEATRVQPVDEVLAHTPHMRRRGATEALHP